MAENNIKKIPGKTTIALQGEIHTLTVQDTYHPECAAIFEELEKINKKLTQAGYEPKPYMQIPKEMLEKREERLRQQKELQAQLQETQHLSHYSVHSE
jgi:hypothetical protein